MPERKPYNDIPLEGLLKYIKADRDHYKDKLNQLIPYAKSLEARNAELQKEIDTLKKANACLQGEIIRTSVYKSLRDRYLKLKRDKETLLEKLAKYDTDTFDLG